VQPPGRRKVQAHAEATAGELNPQQIWSVFEQAYLTPSNDNALRNFTLQQNNDQQHSVDTLTLHFDLDNNLNNGQDICLQGSGDGAISALTNAWQERFGSHVEILDYCEHAESHTSRKTA